MPSPGSHHVTTPTPCGPSSPPVLPQAMFLYSIKCPVSFVSLLSLVSRLPVHDTVEPSCHGPLCPCVLPAYNSLSGRPPLALASGQAPQVITAPQSGHGQHATTGQDRPVLDTTGFGPLSQSWLPLYPRHLATIPSVSLLPCQDQ